jgi:hypothetical protein
MFFDQRVGEVKSKNGIDNRVEEVFNEPDPQRRQALSRQLRAEIWDMLSEVERTQVQKNGFEIPVQGRGLKKIK